MDNIKDLLGEEIKTEIKSLSDLNSGTKEKSMAIDDLAKLYRLRIEETKNEAEVAEKQARREMEKEQSASDNSSHRRTAQLERDRLDEQVKERYFRVGIAAAELVIPLVFYGIWMSKGFKFEESGTFTSNTFKGLINRFRPTKK